MRLSKIPPDHPRRAGLSSGTPAPNCDLYNSEGRIVQLKQLFGDPLLLVFSHSECGPCRNLLPQLNALSRRVPDIKVALISEGDAPRGANMDLQSYIQRHWKVSAAFRMFATPSAFLLDEIGVVSADVAVGTGAVLALLRAAGIRCLLES